MTTIEQVTAEQFATDKNYLLIKPKRTINKGDELIMECDGKQRKEIIKDNITTPGLMKGWQLVEFESIKTEEDILNKKFALSGGQ